MKKCLDEGTLQAFLDNELTSEMSQTVTRHVAVCEPCANILAEIEAESALVFGALEQEFNTLVPTQRLWTKINESIETDKRNRSVWQKVFQPLVAFIVQLLRPSTVALASLMFVFAVFAVLLATKDSGSPVAFDNRPAGETSPVQLPEKTFENVNPSAVPVAGEEKSELPVRIVKTELVKSEPARRNPDPRKTVHADYVVSLSVSPQFIDGEESYVKTIAGLEKTVNENKDAVLNPSARFAFEKDLAVVNDAIKRMRREVRKNPKNESAKQILFSSYNNKIELLNSVNDRGELMASLR